MGLFNRKHRPTDPAAAIEEFWSWWSAEGAGTCAAAIAAGAADRLAPELSSRIDRIEPGLAWELGAGDLSEHKLVVTAEGDAQLRATARRWLLAAPDADTTWSYDDHRAPAAEPDDIVLGGQAGAPDIAFRDVVVGARKSGSRVDVTVHHPAFPDLPEPARLQVAFLALDAALGENDVELWVGQVTPATHPPLDGFGLAALRALVADLRRDALDEDGRPSWALLSGEGASGPVIASAITPLHPLLGPHLTRHIAVAVPYSRRNEGGLPVETSLDELRSLEDRLSADLASDGMLVAHESTAGLRTFHLYTLPESSVVDRLVQRVDDWPDGDVKVRVTDDDAGWESVRHLRG